MKISISKGFGHGFAALSESANFSFKVNNEYYPECCSGICLDDKDLGIDRNLNSVDSILSYKDFQLQNFISPF